MKGKYLCTYSSLRGKLFLFSQGDQHSAIITSMLVRVGHGLKEMLIVNGARGYRWRGLALKVVLGIIFHCNLSHTVHREMVALHFLIQLQPRKWFSWGSFYWTRAPSVQNCERQTQEAGDWSPVVVVQWHGCGTFSCPCLFLHTSLIAPPWTLQANGAAWSNATAQEPLETNPCSNLGRSLNIPPIHSLKH